jgi:plastocyanin
VKRPHLVVLAVIAAAAIATPLALAQRNPAHAASTTIGITGKEFKFALTAPRARHGVIVFRFTNRGTLGHDFKIAGKKTPIIQPGRAATLRVSLRAGTYKYLCTVPGHAASGMKGTFRVN